jgi:hypothetical protein
MKKTHWSVFVAFAAVVASPAAFAAPFSCKDFAEDVAVDFFDASENPSVTQTVFLNKDLEDSDAETGIYGVEVNVNDECLDGAVVYTKVVKGKNGKKSCRKVKVEQWMQRDCG